MDEDKRPFLSGYPDRYGVMRWKFRRKGVDRTIPGQPGEPDFEEMYAALVEGRPIRKAEIVKHPNATIPKSFKDGWARVLKTPEWIAHDDATKTKNERLAKEFLKLRVVEDDTTTWSEIPVADFKRRHAKMILAHFAETPHKAKHVIVAIRKIITVALDEEWIEVDPTYKLSYRPEYGGWRAWTDGERDKFEARWAIGTTPRTCYALALWLGNRRSDVARIEWSMFDFDRGVVNIQQTKGGKHLALPITPMLRENIEGIDRVGDTVLVTAYGKPFSEKSLTGRMADWTHSAGLPKGCTLHGLRKSLGKMLGEGGASTRQLMEVLGHDDIEHAELYSREAAQAILAKDGMEKVTLLVNARKKPV